MTQTPGPWSPFAGLTGVPPKVVQPGAVEQAKAKAALVRQSLFGPETRAGDASRCAAGLDGALGRTYGLYIAVIFNYK